MSSSRSSSPQPASQLQPHPHPHLQSQFTSPFDHPSRPRRRSSITIDTVSTEPFPDFSRSAAAALAEGEGEGASTSTFIPASPYALTGAISASVASSRAGGRPDDSTNIEMEPIVGHRRRKSAALNSPGLPQAVPGRPIAGGSGRTHLSANPADHLDDFEENGGSSSTSIGSGNDDEARGRPSFSDDDLHSDEETGLSNKERARRQKKRQRITQLGQRIVRDKSLSTEERQEADKDVVRKLLVNMFLILLWYFFSLSISLVSWECAVACTTTFFSSYSLFLTQMSRSTTNGCSIKIASTFPFLFLPHHCIWWCNSFSQPWFSILYHRCGHSDPTHLTWADLDMRRRQAAPPCQRCFT